MLLPLAFIKPDPSFENLRLPPTDEEIGRLAESMQREGLKIPITVIGSPSFENVYHVRAGFRRTTAAQKLRWQAIPAIILPPNTPSISEHWVNVIENSARDKLSTYELARAAQTMRDRFSVKAREFAAKAGISEPYAIQLLRCIDRLPPEIVADWRDRRPIPFTYLYQWSNLNPDEAVRQMQIYAGRCPKIVGEWRPGGSPSGPKSKIRMASAIGLRRMQRLRFQIEVARQLTERERQIAMAVVDYCSGAREIVAGINDTDGKKATRAYRSRRREDLNTEMERTQADLNEALSQPTERE
jgi:ParB/RepB/Spo0J family partition protein